MYNGWNNSESLAQLRGALKGTAAQVLMGEGGATLGYIELREELQKCFGVEGHTAQYRAMLKARKRQPGESLRALYQDVCKLLMLSYPGPQNELKDQLAVEAFIESLNDATLEVRVKDHFPTNLAEAFKTALRLEANNSSASRMAAAEKKAEQERSSSETKTRTRYRNDVEARRVNWDDDEMRERVAQLER